MQSKLGEFFLDMLEVVVFAIAIFLFIYLLVLQPHKIKGSSMEPNFPDREFLLTDKVKYRFSDPERGDVIVFKAPGTSGDEFIKRIIGLPGDKVSLQEGSVFINGKKLEETYLPKGVVTRGNAFLREGSEVTVPDKNLFVMGDNRDGSSDSRAWGYVPYKDIKGRAWVIYWPIEKMGTVQKPTYNF